MKYYVPIHYSVDIKDLTRDMVQMRLAQRAALRRLGFDVEWTEAFDAWAVSFDTAEEAALFKLTYL